MESIKCKQFENIYLTNFAKAGGMYPQSWDLSESQVFDLECIILVIFPLEKAMFSFECVSPFILSYFSSKNILFYIYLKL